MSVAKAPVELDLSANDLATDVPLDVTQSSSSSAYEQGNYYRPDVDGLRAVAVLSVIAFHANLHVYTNFKLAPGGFVGVDVFFVISGFLITGIILRNLETGSFSFRTFYSRRIRRIFPSLVAVLFFCWGLGWLTLLPPEYKSLGFETAAGAAFVSNFALWHQAGYFDTATQLKPLVHLWSLGIEEQYYILWPVILVLLGSRYKMVPITIFVGLAALSFLINIAFVVPYPTATFYLPGSRFWELLVGSTLAILVGRKTNFIPLPLPLQRRLRWSLRDVASTTGVLLILLPVFLFRSDMYYPGFGAVLPTAGAALVIAAGQKAWFNRVLLGNRAIVFIGLISYPLYLWHWPLLCFARIAEGGEPSLPAKAAALTLTFVLSCLCYQFLERPVRRMLRPTAAVLPLCAAMFGIAALGILTWQNGFANRFPSDLKPLLESEDATASYRYQECFLDPFTQTGTAFRNSCVDSGHGKLVLLWGDSHAAHLYPGLRLLQSQAGFRLAQYTVAGCVPLVGAEDYARGGCERLNAFLRKQIAELRPSVIILGARWPTQDPRFDAQMDELIGFLRSNGTKNIYLFGPPPRWMPTLRAVLARRYLETGSVPDRLAMARDVAEEIANKERILRALSERLKFNYISLTDALCQGGSCTIRSGPSATELLTADYDHFTKSGSEFAFRLLATRPLNFSLSHDVKR